MQGGCSWREDAVGGRMQLIDDDSEMNESIVQCRDVEVQGENARR